jgi:hypothetical protein
LLSTGTHFGRQQGFEATTPGSLHTWDLNVGVEHGARPQWRSLRSAVIRDGYRRKLDYAPEPEMPAWLAKQLFELLRSIALVSGHARATTADVDRTKRVAFDGIPAVRRTVLRAVARMVTVDETLTTTKVAQGMQYSTATV